MSWNSRNSLLRPASVHWLLHVWSFIPVLLLPLTSAEPSASQRSCRRGSRALAAVKEMLPDVSGVYFFSVLGELTPSWLFKHHLPKPKTWNLLVLSFLLELSRCEELLLALLSWALTLRRTASRTFFPRTPTKRAGWALTQSTRPAVSLGVSAAWMDRGHDIAVKSRAPLSTVTPWIVGVCILHVQMKLEKVFVCFVVVQVQQRRCWQQWTGFLCVCCRAPSWCLLVCKLNVKDTVVQK